MSGTPASRSPGSCSEGPNAPLRQVQVSTEQPSPATEPPPQATTRRLFSYPPTRRRAAALAGAALLATAAVALIALGAAGLLTGRHRGRGAAPRRPRAPQQSVDPAFYGNLHPYMTPADRAALGLNATTADVVVIGAGLAGLAAAQALTQGGMTVLVLESRVREREAAAGWLGWRPPLRCLGRRLPLGWRLSTTSDRGSDRGWSI